MRGRPGSAPRIPMRTLSAVFPSTIVAQPSRTAPVPATNQRPGAAWAPTSPSSAWNRRAQTRPSCEVLRRVPGADEAEGGHHQQAPRQQPQEQPHRERGRQDRSADRSVAAGERGRRVEAATQTGMPPPQPGEPGARRGPCLLDHVASPDPRRPVRHGRRRTAGLLPPWPGRAARPGEEGHPVNVRRSAAVGVHRRCPAAARRRDPPDEEYDDDRSDLPGAHAGPSVDPDTETPPYPADTAGRPLPDTPSAWVG